jgi:ParB-like chromosome segregation protein Spo0J
LSKTPITEPAAVKLVNLCSIGYGVPWRRKVQADRVKALVSSIAEIGLMHPITVRPSRGSGYDLVAGQHRLEAARKLGWKRIPLSIRASMTIARRSPRSMKT